MFFVQVMKLNLGRDSETMFGQYFEGLASHCKAKTAFTFYFSIITLLSILKKAFDREMKSESGFSFEMASQPFIKMWHNV